MVSVHQMSIAHATGNEAMVVGVCVASIPNKTIYIVLLLLVGVYKVCNCVHQPTSLSFD